MLDPDRIRATGLRLLSKFGFSGGSSGGRGELPRSCGVRTWGLLVTLMLARLSGDGFFGGGAGGNLKLCEKEPDAFLVALDSAGVFGAVDTPGVLRAGRAGSGNSFNGSCIAGGDDAPIERGEWCVAERRPGDVTARIISLWNRLGSQPLYLKMNLVDQA